MHLFKNFSVIIKVGAISDIKFYKPKDHGQRENKAKG